MQIFISVKFLSNRIKILWFTTCISEYRFVMWQNHQNCLKCSLIRRKNALASFTLAHRVQNIIPYRTQKNRTKKFNESYATGLNPWMVTWGYFIPPDGSTCCFYGKSLKVLQSLWWLFLILIMLQNCLEIILLTVWLFAIWRPETIGHQQEVTAYCAAYTLCFFSK